ncbi:related to tubulin folding cofactor C [Ramularia collo-cygni]|uniref:Related to tubulin folding cofactor C n=1 Tax=Ramularia collo-cygni TaxID=112498 RepID=A0A2D3V172_9PEZI|nr:related to tubulin folding cofactor C [Ramularia collo-cygni]CZT15249.1 related to tubulin folding cofactor C [Ramularia collo-cygni]
MATIDVGEQQPTPPVSQTPSEKFFRYFQHEVTDLQEQMSRIQNHGTSGGERADAVDHCLSAIARLSTEVQDASAYIPAYDQRTYGDAIKALNTKLQDVRSSVAPRPKFSFKSGRLFTAKKNESAISISDAADLASQRRFQSMQSGSSNVSSFATTPIEVPSPANEPTSNPIGNGQDGDRQDDAAPLPSTAVNIKNREHAHITLPSTNIHTASSGTVTDIEHCVIDMSVPSSSSPFAGLTLKNISHSLVICGHVSGAIHLTNIKNSVVVVASRQFRMHDSSNCDIYLLTTSRPIIEDCSNVRFAPLPQTYMLEDDGKSENQWEKVDDFKWLRNEQSPNWSILEARERLAEDVWKVVVPDGSGAGVDDILKTFKIIE